ncbi:hypothetical protein [Amorphus sp. 3PC139-8]|uniref:hypothetical protein n=1 Tax=Amorphus sp. 3PC139-8 TaxID=2735676 RepID=UPI00345D8CC6
MFVKMKVSFRSLGAAVAMVLTAPTVAMAQNQTLGDIAKNIQSNTLGPVSDAIAGTSFLLGVVFAILGTMKFRAHSQNPNDPNAKLSSAIVMVAVAACLIAIPEVLGVGISTIFGDAQQTSIDGQLRALQ